MRVTINESKYRSGTSHWEVRCYGPDGEISGRRFFPDPISAKKQAALWSNESAESRAIPEALKFEAAECVEQLKAHNWTLRRATEYVIRHVIPYENKPCIRVAVEKFIEDQASRGLSKDTVVGIRHRMGVFAAWFGDEHLHVQTIETFDKWKQALAKKHDPQGVRHFLTHASTFIDWAIPRGYCTSNFIRALNWPIIRGKRPVVFTLGQVEKLFETAPRHGLRTWAVLGTLDGIRPGEMKLLGRLGGAFNRDERLIKIDGDEFSPSERRVIEFEGEWGQANLAWLQRCNIEASIIPHPERKHVEALRRELGFWSHDIMRHTAASAHYALFDNVGKTMKMLGHTGKPDVFHRHYKAVMMKSEARRLYALRPA